MQKQYQHVPTPPLLPCPFCGWELEEERENVQQPIEQDTGDIIYVAACPNCGCGVAPSDTFKGVVKNWNKRVYIPEVSGFLSEYDFLKQLIPTHGCDWSEDYDYVKSKISERIRLLEHPVYIR